VNRYNRKRARSSPTGIGDVLRLTLKKYKLPVHMTDRGLAEAWSEAVGALISSYTAVENLKNKTLYVKVADSVWLQQLQFMKPEIGERLNRILGDGSVNRLHLSIGPPQRRAARETSAAPNPLMKYSLSERDRRMIEFCSSSVRDSDLGALLRRIMTKEVVRRRRMENKSRRK